MNELIPRPFKDLQDLCTELSQNTSISTDIKFAVFAAIVFFYKINVDNIDDYALKDWFNILKERSKLSSPALAEFQKDLIFALVELSNNEKNADWVKDYLLSHDPIDPLLNPKSQLKDDDLKYVIDCLAQFIVYFLRTQDIKQLNLSTIVLEKQSSINWRFFYPDNNSMQFEISNTGTAFKL